MFHMGCDFLPGVCVQAVLSTGRQHVQVGEAASLLFLRNKKEKEKN